MLFATTQNSLLTSTPQQSVLPSSESVGSSNSDRPSLKKTQPYSPDMMPMPLVAPLFIEDQSTHSEMTMVNDSTKPLDVDIVAYAPSGDQLTKKTISVGAHDQSTVKMSELLEEAPSTASAVYGSISVLPHRLASLAAQLSISSTDGLSDIEEELPMLSDMKPANYRAVASGLSGAPAVSVRSLSASEQTVSIGCVLEHGRVNNTELKIRPNQTLLLQPCGEHDAKQVSQISEALKARSDSDNAFGISVSSSAPSSELAVFGIGVHSTNAKGTLVGIPFWDVNLLHSSNAIYAGAAPDQISSAGDTTKLQAAVANFGAVPKKATFLLSSGSGSNSTRKTIATMNLAPHSVSVADLPEVPPDALSSSSLIVNTDGDPGEIISATQALSASTGVSSVLSLPWKDERQVQNGGEHPWAISDSLSSSLTLFNPDPALVNSSIQLTIYAGQSSWTKRLSLPPLATMVLSLNDIIKKQQLDDKGRKIPVSSSDGIVTWTTLAKPRIFGKLVQTDEINRVARVYACGSITSICNLLLQDADPNPTLVGQQTYVAIDTVQACTGCSPCECNDGCGSDSGGGTFYWSSQNDGIASVANSSGYWANYQGNSAGQTWASADGSDSNGCGASESSSITVSGASNWADAFGFPNDGNNILISQDDYNTLVSNNLIAAGAGIVVFVPGAGEIVVLVALSIAVIVLTYQAAQYISANHINVSPPPRKPCTLEAVGGPNNGLITCAYNCPGYGGLATFSCPEGKTCAQILPDGWFTPSRDCQ